MAQRGTLRLSLGTKRTRIGSRKTSYLAHIVVELFFLTDWTSTCVVAKAIVHTNHLQRSRAVQIYTEIKRVRFKRGRLRICSGMLGNDRQVVVCSLHLYRTLEFALRQPSTTRVVGTCHVNPPTTCVTG